MKWATSSNRFHKINTMFMKTKCCVNEFSFQFKFLFKNPMRDMMIGSYSFPLHIRILRAFANQ